MFRTDIQSPNLTSDQIYELEKLRKKCAGHIVEMTTLAKCGHPGGSLSTLDFLLTTYATIRHNPEQPGDPERDRVFVSHGHITPGVYSTLGSYGYFEIDKAVLQFRKAGSPFGGHVENFVPGVEWNTGNLGQGFSAAVGSAMAARLRGRDFRVICCMGDGEQQKGQISEARRFAVKFGLNQVIGFVDFNQLQIGGKIDDIMPQNIADGWRADGWNVIEVDDGHDFASLYRAFRRAYLRETDKVERPTVIIAKTIMGKGVSFMEDKAKYHGTAPSIEQAKQAFQELEQPDRIDQLFELRKELDLDPESHPRDCTVQPYPTIEVGSPVVYDKDTFTDCRSAYGRVLKDLAEENNQDGTKVVCLTCDLEGSVKMGDFRKTSPDAFLESGIQEHNTAVVAGRLSKEGFCTFFSTFGVFAGSEVYNQQRLNDYNGTRVKVVATHCGMDVGEDGPTHQCLDYIALFSHFFSFSIFFPADPNQCDRMIRYMAREDSNFFVAMGRSKLPVITKEDGTPFFDEKYHFKPGKGDVIRAGNDGAILSFGPALHHALDAHEMLKEQGLQAQVVNMGSLKPIDRKAVIEAAATGTILTVEDHHVDTGLGSKVALVLAEMGLSPNFQRLGIHRYSSSGSPPELYNHMGIDGPSITSAFMALHKKGKK